MFDAGTTDTGLRFFVMELVHGVPITDYCDQGRLSTEQRLALSCRSATAIQHAHQKGIIHRDIKPSNVMVTQVDGKPLPKVIDFGVAKAIDQRLTEKTMFTQFGSVVGTLEYMSPEQAYVSGLDVDTRFVRKHRAALLTAGTFVAMLVAMSVFEHVASDPGNDGRRRANEAALRAIAAERELAPNVIELAAPRPRRSEAESARRSAAESEAVRKFLEDDLLAAARPGGKAGGSAKTRRSVRPSTAFGPRSPRFSKTSPRSRRQFATRSAPRNQ